MRGVCLFVLSLFFNLFVAKPHPAGALEQGDEMALAEGLISGR